MERVEPRVLLATFLVTNTNDDTNAGSLRSAITASNAVPGPNNIDFNIPGTGVQTIDVLTALPPVTSSATIDGTTQPGYAGSPLIELDGLAAGPDVDGLDITAGGSAVMGLAINRFTADGINLSSIGGNLIAQDYIGTDPTGNIAEGNGIDGVLVRVNTNDNTIRGNLLSGNHGNGINLDGSVTGAPNELTVGNLIAGNLIGSNAGGTSGLSNGNDGINLEHAPMTTIGGTTAESRNIISANDFSGINFNDLCDNTLIEGNYIGTDSAGTVALMNSVGSVPQANGIFFFGGGAITIGGTTTGAGNVVSGNNQYGIQPFGTSSTALLIEGNLIGTDATGTKPVGNQAGGIELFGQTGVTIGGTVAGARNVISANGIAGPGNEAGIDSFGFGTDILIQGNDIGTDITGTQPLGNAGPGVFAAYPGITIGGAAAGAGNLIANNGTLADFVKSGVSSESTGDTILSNSIFNNNQMGIHQVVLGSSTPGPVPLLTSAVSANITSTIVGSLTEPVGTYNLQFFASPTLDAGGTAEGQTLLGTATLISMGGQNNFTETLPSGFTPGSYITATATDGAGTTSQFSVGIVGTGTNTPLLPPTISATTSTPSVAAGTDATDIFTITNDGPGADLGVIFSDSIPANTTFVTGMTSTGAMVTLANGVATANLGTLASGQAVTVIIVLGTSVATIPSFTNLAEVVSLIPPVFAGADTASVTTDVLPAADLSVTVAGPSGGTPVGSDLTFVVTVMNAGPSDSTGLVLLDTLPAGVSFVSVTESSGPVPTLANGILTDAYGNLAIGGEFTLTIIVNAGEGSIPTATDIAVVNGIEADPDSNNNSASFDAIVTPLADVSLTIVPSATSVDIGGPLTYDVTVTNVGPSTATGVVFTDILPAGVTFVSATASDGSTLVLSGSTLTDTIASLPFNESVSFTITIMTTAATPAMIVDAASAVGNEPDPDPTNNSASVTTSVVAVADVGITNQSLTPAQPVEGQVVLITIDVVNNGPSTATGAIVTTMLPAGLTFVSGLAAGGAVVDNDGVLTAMVGDLTNGQMSVITIAVVATAPGPVTINSSITATVDDPNQANNTATTTINVVTSADLSIALGGTAGPIYTDSPITYTAVITNDGPSAAIGAEFVDTLFAGATFVVVEANGVIGTDVEGVITLPLGTIAAGASVTVILVVIPTLPGSAVDTGAVTSSTPDPDLTNNTASVATTVIVPMSLVTFSSPVYVVNNNAGFAAITLVRSGYEADDVTVHFSTVGIGEAIPGLDYVPVSETVDLPAGTTQVVVFVPVLDDAFENRNNVIDLQLDTPTGSAVLEPNPTVASLTIIDTNPDLIGPTITGVKLTGYVNSITSIEIDTTGNLSPATAENPENYTITALGGVKQGIPVGTIIPVTLAIYDPSTGAVVLSLARALPGNELFLINVNGAHPGALTDLSGNPLNSVYNVTAGSDYLITVARGTDIVYSDETDTPVTLKLTGPGTIDIDRYVAGDVMTLQVVGGIAGKTVVTGTSHPVGLRTMIGSILGLGQFGSIRFKLTTPSFYVANTVYPNINAVDAPATDTLLPSPPVVKPTKPTKPTKVKVTKKSTHTSDVHATEVHSAKAHPAKAHPAKARQKG